MRTIRVHFDNGDELVTSINGTNDEIYAYYLENTFNLGNHLRDVIVKVKKIDFDIDRE